MNPKPGCSSIFLFLPAVAAVVFAHVAHRVHVAAVVFAHVVVFVIEIQVAVVGRLVEVVVVFVVLVIVHFAKSVLSMLRRKGWYPRVRSK